MNTAAVLSRATRRGEPHIHVGCAECGWAHWYLASQLTAVCERHPHSPPFTIEQESP